MTPRVVLDTNVVVSALLKPQGLESQVLRFALAGHLRLCASETILAEYAAVLPRPKLKLTEAEVATALTAIRAASVIVRPKTGSVNAATDEPDNRFLECAEAARAAFLVTGNWRHFPARWKTTQIVTARELFSALSPSGSP